MIPEDKIWATRHKLKRGYPQGDLIQELLEEGYSREEVNAIFNDMVPKKSGATKEFPFSYLLGLSLIITGISILAVFSGSTLGYFFLLGGGICLLIGFYFEEEKKKFRS